MSITNCRECGQEVSENANECPRCGIETPCREKYIGKLRSKIEKLDSDEKTEILKGIGILACGLLVVGGCIRHSWHISSLPDPEIVEQKYITSAINDNQYDVTVLNKNNKSGLIEVTVEASRSQRFILADREWKQKFSIDGSQRALCQVPLPGDSIFNDIRFFRVSVKRVDE